MGLAILLFLKTKKELEERW